MADPLSASPIKRELVTDAAALGSLARAWFELLHRSDCDEPFLAPQWMRAWWDVFGPRDGRALRVMLFRDGDRLVGIAPLLGRKQNAFPFPSRRRLEVLGSGEEEADETCSDYLGIIAERGTERRVAESLAEALVRGDLGAWDDLVLRAMNADSALPAILTAAMNDRGFHVETTPGQPSPYIPLPTSWEAYLAQLSSSRRSLVRQSLRKFETWAGAPARIQVAANAAELQIAMRALHTLHRARWALEGKKGAFDSERFAAFHDRVTPAFLEIGALQVGTLDARGAPVGAFYNLVWNQKSYFYQSGRTGDVPPSVRVGIVMHACLVRHCIECGMREYDFLPGASRYKMALALATRPIVSLRIARPSLLESAHRVTARVLAIGRAIRRQVPESGARV